MLGPARIDNAVCPTMLCAACRRAGTVRALADARRVPSPTRVGGVWADATPSSAPWSHLLHRPGASGNDLVLVAELSGHRRLETTRRYSLPSAADRQAAMEAFHIEY
jgi:hypothetical protein